MAAPEIIKQLVAKFTENRDAYRSGKYNEAQLRLQFLDPFFEALGWDVRNSAEVSPDYQDVIIEETLSIEGTSKAPDYTFRIGNKRIFFVEAKKPKVDIKYDIHPAYQLRNYAWNSKLPMSILTDFEEFAIYNCQDRPKTTDPVTKGRVFLYHFTEYVEKWDKIAEIFSREAVWKGAYDRYAKDELKKGTIEVDDAILKSIENWRKLLAINIKLNLREINEDQLNYAVQMTIDRILFLRICEDRGNEPKNQFKNLLTQPGIYNQMVDLFKRADTKYNSGLFHINKKSQNDGTVDTLTPKLIINDKVLKDLISDLYLPKCNYLFNIIPVEILGQVYEQFLGKVIRFTSGGHVKIDPKPEVRKAGGVYYTPKYIVDYIVQNTLGRLLEGKTPEQAAEIKVVDPACGSGSFLLGAYQYLLDWHIKWYTENKPEIWIKGKNPVIVARTGGGWKLTTPKKKEILVNNIFGVDIDEQAVEVTKLSLLLKVLEEETGQMSLGFDQVLPDLGKNIQCGNSLIGEIYFAGQLIVNETERQQVNPFDWASAFPSVFGKGGFDVVIGNPPYGATLDKKSKKFLNENYPIVSDFESSQYFIVQSNKILNKSGLLGFIVPNTLFLNLFANKFRSFLVDNYSVDAIANLSAIDVFEGATVRTVISFLSKNKKSNTINFYFFEDKNQIILTNSVDQTSLAQNDKLWIKFLGSKSTSLQERINSNSIALGSILDISQGLIPYDKYRGHDEFTIKNRIWNADYKKDDTFKQELRGGDVTRYSVVWNGKQWISYGPWLGAPRKPKYFTQPRLLFREITDPKTGLLHVAYCDKEYYNNPGIINCVSMGLPYSLYFLLGVCASKLISFYHFSSSPKANKGVFPKILVNDVRSLPIHTIDFSKPAEVKQHDRMVALVERMLELHKRVAQTPQEQERLTREIASTDRQIDQLVYELYGLTDEEIRIVEGG